MTTQIIGASRGDPLTRYLFDALARRYIMVDRINTELRPWQRYLVALTTFHPIRPPWQERFFKSLLACKLRSSNSRFELERINQPHDVVVQVHALFRTLGAPYIVYVDNTHHQSVQGWSEWNPLNEQELERWYAFERTIYQQALHLFTMGQPAAQSLMTFYNIPEKQISNVGGGANFDVLPILTRELREPVILFVGNDFRRKGGERLLEAFRQVRVHMPTARLQIVGATEVPSEPGVEVFGRIHDRQRLAQLYAHANVFCLPSYFDPYPLVLIEAMAYGLPCVSTHVGAIPEIVIDGHTGLLVSPDDVTALATALIRLLEDQPYRDLLGAAGRQRVEQYFNWDRVVDRMAPILDRLSKPSRSTLRYQAEPVR